VLPLHVFEPRYRALTKHVLASDRRMAIVRLRPGFENDYEGRPPVYDIAGVGEVVQSQALPDGRYNLLVRGLGRIRIEREHASEAEVPYRLVVALPLNDEYPPGDLGVARAALQALAEKLAAALPQGGDVLRGIIRDADEPGALADVLAASVILEPNARQQLIETVNVGTRVEQVSAAIATLLQRLPAGAQNPVN
jgi:Lon protease-like protein